MYPRVWPNKDLVGSQSAAACTDLSLLRKRDALRTSAARTVVRRPGMGSLALVWGTRYALLPRRFSTSSSRIRDAQ